MSRTRPDSYVCFDGQTSVILDDLDATHPYADVIPGTRGALIATLAQLATPVTVRALARHASVSPQGALDVVNDLDDAGLLVVTRAGSALMVSLNRDHLAVDALTALVGLRGRLIERLTEELNGWSGLAGAWLYGSMARGDGGRQSDVDLLLIAAANIEHPVWAQATTQLRDQVRGWTGNDTQLVEHSRESFARLVKRRNPLIAAVRADGIPLTVNSPSLLRGAA